MRGMAMRPLMIEAKRLTKAYMSGELRTSALRGVDVEVEKGEFIAIMGASGSGKTTLMNLLGCLTLLTTGSIG
jgi:putative ABC transport system ATP-binding protein